MHSARFGKVYVDWLYTGHIRTIAAGENDGSSINADIPPVRSEFIWLGEDYALSSFLQETDYQETDYQDATIDAIIESTLCVSALWLNLLTYMYQFSAADSPH